uniref:Uncharacterized protein n=2 Tax=Anguilla anguilla TaxID=7936 RepID=A0A0E9VVV6_ANGAN
MRGSFIITYSMMFIDRHLIAMYGIHWVFTILCLQLPLAGRIM